MAIKHKSNNPMKKIDRGTTKFFKENIQMANRYSKRCSVITRKTQIKTTVSITSYQLEIKGKCW